MKAVLGEVLREFYEFGIPEDVKPRAVDYLEKKNSATVVTGMRRTGKTYVTYQRMRALHFGQCDGGHTTDSSRGMRQMQTFRKLAM